MCSPFIIGEHEYKEIKGIAGNLAEALDWLRTTARTEPLCFCEPRHLRMMGWAGGKETQHTEYCNKARQAIAEYTDWKARESEKR